MKSIIIPTCTFIDDYFLADHTECALWIDCFVRFFVKTVNDDFQTKDN